MTTIQTNSFVVPQDDASKKKLRDACSEISDSMTRISAERDLIKDIVNTISDELNIPKKFINKTARIYHKQNYANVISENEQLEILCEVIQKP